MSHKTISIIILKSNAEKTIQRAFDSLKIKLVMILNVLSWMECHQIEHLRL